MSKEVQEAILAFQTAINFKTTTVMPIEYNIDIENAKMLLKYIEQLQQENKELKEKNKKIKFENTYTNIVHNAFQTEKKEKRYYENILTKLEKWLEEKINSPKLSLIEIITFKRCLEELQELKEGKK